MPYTLQAPGEKLDYSFDWTDFLAEGGSPQDTVSSAVWSITPINDGSPTEPAITGETISGVTTSAFVQGVSDGTIYSLTCRATTGQGRISKQSITIRGGER